MVKRIIAKKKKKSKVRFNPYGQLFSAKWPVMTGLVFLSSKRTENAIMKSR